MIVKNPIDKDGNVLPSGPITYHVHNLCGNDGIYVTYDIRSHASETFIASTVLVLKEGLVPIAKAHETHKAVFELYTCPEAKLGAAVLMVSVKLDDSITTLEPAKYLLRFFRWSEERVGTLFNRPLLKTDYHDVRLIHFNEITAKYEEGKMIVDVSYIKKGFFADYEKVRLIYDGESVKLTASKEEEIDLIERKTQNTAMYSFRNFFRTSGIFCISSSTIFCTLS